MKSWRSLHTKETICWTKGESLLTSVDTRTNVSFYGTIAKSKSYVFTLIFLAVFPLEPNGNIPILACAVYVLHIWLSKQKLSSSKQRFHWRILQGIFPVNITRKWRHLFVWILLHCNFFVIHYIFRLKIAIRHETLSIKTCCFHFSPA